MTINTPEAQSASDATLRETGPAGSQTDEVPEADVSAIPNPENGSQGPKGNREARYRVERNEARAERDALAERVAQLQTREVERLASTGLSNPADVFTLGGIELADLLDEAGEVDPDKVSAVVQDILGTRPGLRPNDPGVDPTQGYGGTGNPSPSWADLLAR